jgi:hypothetical protein
MMSNPVVASRAPREAPAQQFNPESPPSLGRAVAQPDHDGSAPPQDGVDVDDIINAYLVRPPPRTLRTKFEYLAEQDGAS